MDTAENITEINRLLGEINDYCLGNPDTPPHLCTSWKEFTRKAKESGFYAGLLVLHTEQENGNEFCVKLIPKEFQKENFDVLFAEIIGYTIQESISFL